MTQQKGFSLIELMIYLALFLVILTTLYQMLDTNRATYASGERKMDVQQNARVSMDEGLLRRKFRRPHKQRSGGAQPHTHRDE
jgi:prepilin-type N-terminal cleavage/methylation domain-containing protein